MYMDKGADLGTICSQQIVRMVQFFIRDMTPMECFLMARPKLVDIRFFIMKQYIHCGWLLAFNSF